MKKKSLPFFSIVIPTYNRAPKLRFALYCLLRQTFKNFEIIVSDNWSTDETKQTVLGFKDKRVHYIKNSKPTIYSLNLQNAINHARGKYIFFHSDDDLLPDDRALKTMMTKITKTKPGFVRVNYVCISPKRDSLFFFNRAQPYKHDTILPAKSKSNEILNFLVNSDHYFISGIIYKNDIPKDLKLIKSEHAPWIAILYYVLEKHGGFFIAEPYIAASWSVWRFKRNGNHPVYSLHNGKLESEYYFEALRNKLSTSSLATHMHVQFMRNYVLIFPVIKILVGNRQLLALSKRIKELDPKLSDNPRFWIYLLVSLVVPAYILFVLKNTYRSRFMNISKITSSDEKMKKFRHIEDEYLKRVGKPFDYHYRFF